MSPASATTRGASDVTALPDCPRPGCGHLETTLTVERIEPKGVRVCSCSCCGQRCRVNADGAVVHVPDRRDVSGNEMFEDGDY